MRARTLAGNISSFRPWEVAQAIQMGLLKGAPAGIWTRVFGLKGRNDWPGYTTGATGEGDIINQPGPLPMRSTRYIYISDGLGILSSPGRIRTAVAGSKGPQD